MAAFSIICFLIGSGLIWLGAFFLWRLVAKRNRFWILLPMVLPVGLIALCAVWGGVTEMASSLLWGTIAINLGLVGVLNLCFRAEVSRTNHLMAMLLLMFGWLACIFARRSGDISCFGGCGLVVIGIISLWQIGSMKTEIESLKLSYIIGWRWWLCLLGAELLIGIGTCFIVWQYSSVAAICSMPTSIFAAVVLAPICSISALFGLRYKGQWQPLKVLHGLTWGSVLLSNLGLGLAAILSGNLHLTQSTLVVTLPGIAGLAGLVVVTTYLPQKTARWWGGLTFVFYLGLMISLFL